MLKKSKEMPDRVQYFEDMNRMDAVSFFNKYYPDSVRTRILRVGRVVTCRLGIHDTCKRLLMNIRKGVKGKK